MTNVLRAALLATLLAATAESAPQCTKTLDGNGTWAVHSVCDETDCGDDPDETYDFLVEVVQVDTDITLFLPDGSPLVGTLCADQLDVTGAYPEDGGTTTTHMIATVAADGLSLTGSSAWTWTDGVSVCTGTCSLSASMVLVGGTYCDPAVPNSTGSPAEIRASGSLDASANQLTLTALQLPTLQFGYFLASQTQDLVANPGGSQGNLCLGGVIARFNAQIQNSGQAGIFSIPVDLTQIPLNPPHAVLAGETWSFQCWYRDLNPNTTSNFTNGVALTFS